MELDRECEHDAPRPTDGPILANASVNAGATSRRVELVRFPVGSDRTLDGVLVEPTGGPPAPVVLHLHGKGGNFYSSTSRFIPELTAHQPMSHLSINMTCHDLAYTRDDRYTSSGPGDPERVGGGMWEDLAQGPRDVSAAIDLLSSRGYEDIIVAGHSSGGYYATVAAAADPRIRARVLLSPLTANRTAFQRWFPSEGDLDATLARARQLMDENHGHWIIPLESWYFGISARSFLERAAEPPGVFTKALRSSQTPLLAIWGRGEGRDRHWDELFDQVSQELIERLVLPTSDHYYLGWEQPIADAVAAFVRKQAGGASS